MKVLYHYTGPIIDAFNFIEPSSKKLKSVDYLIDLQISICKIEKNLVLTDDGNLFSLDASPFYETEGQSVSYN